MLPSKFLKASCAICAAKIQESKRYILNRDENRTKKLIDKRLKLDLGLKLSFKIN